MAIFVIFGSLAMIPGKIYCQRTSRTLLHTPNNCQWIWKDSLGSYQFSKQECIDLDLVDSEADIKLIHHRIPIRHHHILRKMSYLPLAWTPLSIHCITTISPNIGSKNSSTPHMARSEEPENERRNTVDHFAGRKPEIEWREREQFCNPFI